MDNIQALQKNINELQSAIEKERATKEELIDMLKTRIRELEAQPKPISKQREIFTAIVEYFANKPHDTMKWSLDATDMDDLAEVIYNAQEKK